MSKRRHAGPPRDYPRADSAAWLYLIGRSADKKGPARIKIGVTGMPEKRMRQHRDGGVIAWQHFCTSGTRQLMLEIERAVIRAFAAASVSCSAFQAH